MGHELRLERVFDAPPEVVVDAFLDRRAQFGEEGRAQIESELDLRVGGTWTVVYGWRDAEADRETRCSPRSTGRVGWSTGTRSSAASGDAASTAR